jgi:hypothetical protein
VLPSLVEMPIMYVMQLDAGCFVAQTSTCLFRSEDGMNSDVSTVAHGQSGPISLSQPLCSPRMMETVPPILILTVRTDAMDASEDADATPST